MDAREIAGRLTPAHFAALQRRFEWGSLVEQEAGESDLYRLGLWHEVKVPTVKRNGKKGWFRRVEPTELGREVLAVRRVVEGG